MTNEEKVRKLAAACGFAVCDIPFLCFKVTISYNSRCHCAYYGWDDALERMRINIRNDNVVVPEDAKWLLED